MTNKRSQISETTDKKLKAESLKIGAADAQIEAAQAQKDWAWESILEIFDELGNTGPFYTEEGRTLMLQARNSPPKLDQLKLERLLRERMGNKFNGIWNAITNKTVDTALLERQVLTGKIPGDILEACMEYKPVTFARIRREFTKEDTERAATLYGIEPKKVN